MTDEIKEIFCWECEAWVPLKQVERGDPRDPIGFCPGCQLALVNYGKVL